MADVERQESPHRIPCPCGRRDHDPIITRVPAAGGMVGSPPDGTMATEITCPDSVPARLIVRGPEGSQS